MLIKSSIFEDIDITWLIIQMYDANIWISFITHIWKLWYVREIMTDYK